MYIKQYMNTHMLLNKLLAHLYTFYPYASKYFIRWSKMSYKYSWHICYTWFVIRQAHGLQLLKCISYSMKNMIYNNTIIILLSHKHKLNVGFVMQKQPTVSSVVNC